MYRKKYFYVYILTNKSNKVIYTGVTNNLVRRIYEHRIKLNIGFTSKYNIYKLVYFETYEDAFTAIHREKQIKKWRREKKDQLINTKNPDWIDLFLQIE
jgi:putative endonuclease